jgi:GNAT superfamily N-acetyltransferase
MVARLGSGTSWKCWLAIENDRPIGAAWLQLLEKIPNPVGEPELHGYISSLFVVAERRGAGIGSALLRACLGECESRGADAVFLWPTPRSRSLYRRHGFEVRDDLLELRLSRPAGAPH